MKLIKKIDDIEYELVQVLKSERSGATLAVVHRVNDGDWGLWAMHYYLDIAEEGFVEIWPLIDVVDHEVLVARVPINMKWHSPGRVTGKMEAAFETYVAELDADLQEREATLRQAAQQKCEHTPPDGACKP